MARLHRDCRGASAAEFALVLPLLLLLLFGIIDGGRFIWEFNRAEKATQTAARFAAVTAPVAGGITTADFVGVGGLTAGKPIPAGLVPDIVCNSSSCSCAACPAGLPGAYSATAFNNIVAQVKRYEHEATAANVQVIYRSSGLGYAGDPTGPDYLPLVTVRLTGLQFVPVTTLAMTSITKPSFATTMTAEDLAGTQQN